MSTPFQTSYPDAIDSTIELPLATDNVTPVKADVVNCLRGAIVAIERELGIQPSSTFSTVKTRLDAIDLLLSQLSDGTSVDLSSINAQLLEIAAELLAINSSIININSEQIVLQSEIDSLQDQINNIGGGSANITGTYNCDVSITLLDFVYLDASNHVILANAFDPLPAIGVVILKPTSITATVQYLGEVTGFSGLISGARYYLSATVPGSITNINPSLSISNPTIGVILQDLGFAKNSTTLVLQESSGDYLLLFQDV